MLNDATGFSKVYLAVGYTDLRLGISGLSMLVSQNFQLEPYEKNVLFLFCGRKTDRIKGLVFEGDGHLLLYKKLESGKFQWPRSEKEMKNLTPQQYKWLMEGLSISPKKRIRELEQKPVSLL